MDALQTQCAAPVLHGRGRLRADLRDAADADAQLQLARPGLQHQLYTARFVLCGLPHARRSPEAQRGARGMRAMPAINRGKSAFSAIVPLSELWIGSWCY